MQTYTHLHPSLVACLCTGHCRTLWPSLFIQTHTAEVWKWQASSGKASTPNNGRSSCQDAEDWWTQADVQRSYLWWQRSDLKLDKQSVKKEPMVTESVLLHFLPPPSLPPSLHLLQALFSLLIQQRVAMMLKSTTFSSGLETLMNMN